MALFLGIDAGGSKTECVIGDEQEVVGRSIAGSCKIQQVGGDAAAKNLLAGVRGALLEAGVEGKQVVNSCVGISGVSNPEVEEFVTSTLRAVVQGGVMVIGDHIVAHEAAFRGGAGVLVIAGTGSIAYGRNQQGYTARAGGRGAEVSDEGSGFWIGREAVAAVVHSMDSAKATELEKRLTEKWKIATKEELRAKLSSPKAPFAELLPEVLAASRAGDAVAMEVLVRAGKELANLAVHVIAKLWLQRNDGEVRVAGAGGVLANSAEVREALREALKKQRFDARFDDSEVHPVDGALFLARRAALEARQDATR